MDQLICHLLGDYVLQTDWMAKTKSSSLLAAVIHSLIYSLPFLLITGISWAILIIFSTHTVIDRYRLAGYVMKLKAGTWRQRGKKPANPREVNYILAIVIDNTIHLAINYLAIKYFG